MLLAHALCQAGLVKPEEARKAEEKAQRNERISSLKERTFYALQRAQRTNQPQDWRRYADLKRRLPSELRGQY